MSAHVAVFMLAPGSSWVHSFLDSRYSANSPNSELLLNPSWGKSGSGSLLRYIQPEGSGHSVPEGTPTVARATRYRFYTVAKLCSTLSSAA